MLMRSWRTDSAGLHQVKLIEVYDTRITCLLRFYVLHMFKCLLNFKEKRHALVCLFDQGLQVGRQLLEGLRAERPIP